MLGWETLLIVRFHGAFQSDVWVQELNKQNESFRASGLGAFPVIRWSYGAPKKWPNIHGFALGLFHPT